MLSFLSSSSNISNNDISLYFTNPQLWIETSKLLFVYETTLVMVNKVLNKILKSLVFTLEYNFCKFKATEMLYQSLKTSYVSQHEVV